MTKGGKRLKTCFLGRVSVFMVSQRHQW